MMKLTAIAPLFLASCLGGAQAGFVYHDSATTDGGSFSSAFPIANLKNAAHASPDDLENANDSGESYATANPPAGDYPVRIVLNFDSDATLEKLYLWNHSNNGGTAAPANGIGNFSLSFHDAVGGGGNLIGSVFQATAAAAPSTGTYPAEVFDFGTTYADVRSVVLTIRDKQNDETSGFVAVREIGFEGTVTRLPPATPDKVIVYLVGGQSNADGYGVTGQLPSALREARPEIDFYHGNGGGNSPLLANEVIPLQPGSGSMGGNAGGFGSELNFGIGIHESLGSGKARIAIIKHTRGGTNLHTDWFPNGNATTSGDGPDYRAFQSTVGQGLDALRALYPAATVRLEGMVWHQGEGDSRSSSHAGNYQGNLTNFITDIRATFAAPELKFGIVQLSDNQTALDTARRTTVKAAQAAVASSDTYNFLVLTDDLAMASGSTIHFGTDGNLTIGTRLANGMRKVPISDSDGNGLDDAWEESNWGAGETGQNPGGDDDNDGRDNFHEFLWLTDPLTSDSITPRLLTSGDTTISWPSSPDRSYIIRISSDLLTWERFDSFIPGSSGTSTSYTLPAEPSVSKRFFQIGAHR